MHAIFIMTFLKKEKAKELNVDVKNIETFSKEKKIKRHQYLFCGSAKHYPCLESMVVSGKYEKSF